MKSFAATVLALVCCAAPAYAQNAVVAKLPDFKLQDPHGKEHTQEELKPRGAVIIITIPNVKHASQQDQWARWLTKKGWQKDGPLLVFIEDLTQTAELLRARALAELKEKHREGKQPLLLLDPLGAVRKSFGINVDETVVVVVNAAGQIVHVAEEEPTVEKVKAIQAVLEAQKSR